MTNKQTMIVTLIRCEHEKAVEAYRRASAERAGMDAAAKVWEETHPDDGVGCFSQNPYVNTGHAEREEAASLYAAEVRDAYKFAVDTFIGHDSD